MNEKFDSMNLAWQENDGKTMKEIIEDTGILGIPSLLSAPGMDMYLDSLLVLIETLIFWINCLWAIVFDIRI